MYQQLAKQLGITQTPEQSDTDFIRWLDNLRNHRALLREAKELGVVITFGMKSFEIRQAICNRQQELLQERGFVPEAEVELGERNVRIQRIVVETGRDPKVTVHYWIIRPWSKLNNQGRANHRSAKDVLKNAKLIR
jgi:hypothetical protein